MAESDSQEEPVKEVSIEEACNQSINSSLHLSPNDSVVGEDDAPPAVESDPREDTVVENQKNEDEMNMKI